MKTAIITGASSGLGTEYARKLPLVFPDIECVWLIARRAERLQAIAATSGVSCVCLSLDLTKDEDLDLFRSKLRAETPDVKLLVNCAGCGYLGNVDETEGEKLSRMTDLNIRALTLVTSAVLPYMNGGHILNVSSIASFCPNPRMTVYSSTKAYVSSFTLGLSEELRPRGITVTAVCPGPMSTEFLDAAGISGNSKMFDTLPYCDAAKVAESSLKAAKRGRVFHTPLAFFKFYRFLAKLIPHTILVKLTKT